MLIVVGFIIDTLITYTITNLGIQLQFPTLVSCIIAIWLVCNELISILENLIDIGVEVPSFLKPLVEKIKNEVESKGE